MLSVRPELVWKGRLGDEPGVYGDAAYSGIALELPLTLRKADPAGPDITTLVLRTQDLCWVSRSPYYSDAYQPDPDDPAHATETVLTTERLTSATITVRRLSSTLPGLTPRRLSAFESGWIRAEVPRGLYDNFVVSRLLNSSANLRLWPPSVQCMIPADASVLC